MSLTAEKPGGVVSNTAANTTAAAPIGTSQLQVEPNIVASIVRYRERWLLLPPRDGMVVRSSSHAHTADTSPLTRATRGLSPPGARLTRCWLAATASRGEADSVLARSYESECSRGGAGTPSPRAGRGAG